MKRAKKLAKANRWKAAADVWANVVKGDKGKLGAKAKYNLALYFETRGELGKALRRAQAAASVLGNARSRNYVRTLERRQRDAARLRRQMQPAPKSGPRNRRR